MPGLIQCKNEKITHQLSGWLQDHLLLFSTLIYSYNFSLHVFGGCRQRFNENKYVFGCVHHGVKERERKKERERRQHHISSTKRAPAAKVFDRRHQKIPFYSVRLPLCIKGTSVQTLLATFLSSFR